MCGVVALVAIAFGLVHDGHRISYSYRNWFGGLVFGPVVTALGIVILLGAIFNWRKISRIRRPEMRHGMNDFFRRRYLIRRFVIARLRQGRSKKAVRAQADIDLRLAEDAVFLALAARFTLFTLHADNAAGSGFGGHGLSLERGRGTRNVTEVMRTAALSYVSLEPRAKANCDSVTHTVRLLPLQPLAARDSKRAAVLT